MTKLRLVDDFVKLPVHIINDIEEKNLCRRLNALQPIIVKVRSCLKCNRRFESFGNRTCGCQSTIDSEHDE